MTLIDYLKEVDEEVKIINSSDYTIEVIDTDNVPNFDDSSITYDNLDNKTKRCKRIETCVLYVDIRNSTTISVEKKPVTLARMYSSFVKSMLGAARYYGGHVRNIIGDRVMVVFDKDKCFTNAVNTAILMNTISQFILNRYIKSIDFKCGIGIDYGKMLIVKAGVIRRNAEKEFYRSLVWLGKPANIASKLTDQAFKTEITTIPGVKEGHHYPSLNEWGWYDKTFEQFIDNLEETYTRNLRHKSEYFKAFFKTTLGPYSHINSPILFTEQVYTGYCKENPNADSIKKGWWSKKALAISGYNGAIYGGDVYFTDVKEINNGS